MRRWAVRPRLIDAIITPGRLLAWLVFKGLERIRMARLQQRPDGHVMMTALEAEAARTRGPG